MGIHFILIVGKVEDRRRPKKKKWFPAYIYWTVSDKGYNKCI